MVALKANSLVKIMAAVVRGGKCCSSHGEESKVRCFYGRQILGKAFNGINATTLDYPKEFRENTLALLILGLIDCKIITEKQNIDSPSHVIVISSQFDLHSLHKSRLTLQIHQNVIMKPKYNQVSEILTIVKSRTENKARETSIPFSNGHIHKKNNSATVNGILGKRLLGLDTTLMNV